MKKHLTIVSLIAALVIGLVACGGDDKSNGRPAKPGVLVIMNNTGEDLTEIDLSASSEEETWENKNLLDGKTLKNGESIEIPVSLFAKNENYDLSFGSEENTYFKMEVDVKNAGSITVEKSDLFVNDEEEDAED